jgi:hypothetical protein
MIPRLEVTLEDDGYTDGKEKFQAVSPVALVVRMGEKSIGLGPRELYEIVRMLINRNLLRVRVRLPDSDYRRLYTVMHDGTMRQAIMLECFPQNLALLDADDGASDGWDWDDADCLLLNSHDEREVQIVPGFKDTGLKATKVRKPAAKKKGGK